ncbi:hypothetical protein Nocox_29685 [Nonomuraea coxensis DSM 45129]|uniref:Tetratricopeptide repeat protein n=1 Tax=Nonomuraea coxensis DSM 45129 TaxID=1122611 RepID=A0ABX8U6Y9_9ACTN|nr:hypothetical protein [Nonomuraea coxensis]QYC43521.1 hypothetical protein Nocox_29685 [Nonomuraea coxensis DSM 45129]
MTRNGPDDATRKGTAETAEIEGLIALAATRPKWGRAALNVMSEAIAKCRVLRRRSPGEHDTLLARCLWTTALMLLDRRQTVEALPLAQEAVALTRERGGAPLVQALRHLASVQEALGRFSEAAATLEEADRANRPPD